MHEFSKIAIGILILIAGVPLGDFLYRKTKEEIKSGQKWFGLIIGVCLLGAIISAFFVNDFLFFSFLFIAIVTSRSLIGRKRKK
ncbi:MAG: hypothetical protein ABIH28_03780 [archaeon]